MGGHIIVRPVLVELPLYQHPTISTHIDASKMDSTHCLATMRNIYPNQITNFPLAISDNNKF